MALDFQAIKKSVLEYINSLDHPNRDTSNTFSKNLAIAGKAHHTEITIYSAGLAIVSQEKNVTLDHSGNVKLMYTDVPSKVDLSSVSMLFDHNVTLYSQKYAYDVVNYQSLLRRYVGKYVLYIDEKGDKKQKKAILLATDPIIIKDVKSGIIFTPYKVFFENIPEDMAVTPSLFWDLHTDAEELTIKLEYLTDAISWKSDYNLYLKSSQSLDLSSWITASTHSGASFRDAKITVVTGEVQRLKQPKEHNQSSDTAPAPLPKESELSQENNTSRYSVYEIPHRENLMNKEQKQIVFIRKKGISYRRYLLNEKTYHFNEANSTTLSFSNILAFENRLSNHLGVSLPRGVVRVYDYGSAGVANRRFIGSTTMPDIKEGELIELNIGKDKEVTAIEKMQIQKGTDGKRTVHYRITVKNMGDRIKPIKLRRTIPKQVDDVTITDTCQDPCSSEKPSKLSRLYRIDLEADKHYELNITYILTPVAKSVKESL
jgi:hypothetical protein